MEQARSGMCPQGYQQGYQVMDEGRPIGWVVAPSGALQAGPGAATVLLTRCPGTNSRQKSH